MLTMALKGQVMWANNVSKSVVTVYWKGTIPYMQRSSISSLAATSPMDLHKAAQQVIGAV